MGRMLGLGAVWGSLLDGLHTHSGTTAYAEPSLWLMAWWTPLLFAGAYTLLGLGYALARGDHRVESTSVVFGCAVAFTLLYASSGYLPVSNGLKLGVLLAGAAGLWVVTGRNPRTLALGVASAILGPVTEIILVHFGVFAHLQPDAMGIPIWLPGLYLASAPGAGPLAAWMGVVTRAVRLPAPAS